MEIFQHHSIVSRIVRQIVWFYPALAVAVCYSVCSSIRLDIHSFIIYVISLAHRLQMHLFFIVHVTHTLQNANVKHEHVNVLNYEFPSILLWRSFSAAIDHLIIMFQMCTMLVQKFKNTTLAYSLFKLVTRHRCLFLVYCRVLDERRIHHDVKHIE